MLLFERVVLISLFLGPMGCASREYGAATLLSPRSARSVYPIQPAAAVWIDALMLRVIAPDTFRIRLAKGQGDETVSLFGVRALSNTEVNPEFNFDSTWARQQTLDVVMPGQNVSVEPVSRSENGKLFVIIKTEARENLAIELAKKGLVVPSVVCRNIDVCTPPVLSLLRLDAVALACELHFAENKGRAVPQTRDEPDPERDGAPSWVGDVVSHEFVPYRERDRIPFCRRALFSGRSMSAVHVEKLGFKPLGFD